MNVIPVANQSDLDSFDSECIEYNDLESDWVWILQIDENDEKIINYQCDGDIILYERSNFIVLMN